MSLFLGLVGARRQDHGRQGDREGRGETFSKILALESSRMMLKMKPCPDPFQQPVGLMPEETCVS